MASWLREVCQGGEDRRESDELRWRARKLECCASWLEFRHYFTVDQVRLSAGYFCQQDKLCPACALRRGAKMLHRQSVRVALMLDEHPWPVELCMVTTTVKNGPDLVERFNHHRQALKTLDERRKAARLGKMSSAASICEGGFSSYEIKRGEGLRGGGWHPHNHAAWIVPGGTDYEQLQDDLRREWKHITGDSHILDVRPFHFVRAGLPATAETVAPDFAEVCKYSLKFSTMDFGDNWHAATKLRGRRLLNSWGMLYGVEVPQSLLDDPLDADDLPFVELCFRFSQGGYLRC